MGVRILLRPIIIITMNLKKLILCGLIVLCLNLESFSQKNDRIIEDSTSYNLSDIEIRTMLKVVEKYKINSNLLNLCSIENAKLIKNLDRNKVINYILSGLLIGTITTLVVK